MAFQLYASPNFVERHGVPQTPSDLGEFPGIVLNVAKFGIFVELDDLFVEGLVPLATLQGDRYRFNEYSRQILGESSGHRISVGDRVHVILDRIDALLDAAFRHSRTGDTA